LRQFVKQQDEAAAAIAAKGEGPVPARVRPSARLWQSMARMEQRIGRPDKADRHALAAVVEEEDAAGVVPGRRGGPSGNDVGGEALEGLFPDRGRTAAAWWQFFREKFADDDPAGRLARVRAVMDGKADAKDVSAWAADIRGSLGGPANSFWVSSRLQTLAETLYAYGRVDEAEAALERAAAAWPAGNALSRAADAAFDRGDWDRAADFYRRAATLQDGPAPLLYLRGVALRKAGRAADADAAVALARVLPLGDERQRLELAEAMEKNGDAAAAEAQAELSSRTGRLSEYEWANARRRWAYGEAQAGRFAAAADALEQSVLPVFRTNTWFDVTSRYLHVPAVVHVWRSRGHLEAGDVPAAVREADAAADAVPLNVEITIELVNAFDEKGAKKEADALFARSWAWHAKLSDQFPRYGQGYNAAAWLAARCNRDLDKALELANKAVASAPNNPAFIDTLAEVLFRMGRRDEAVAQMKKCMEIEPKSAYFQGQMKRFTAPATQPAK
jgi:tetratricopeptide (TPR) repeat protein